MPVLMRYFYLFLASFLWSTSFPVVKWGLSYIEPMPFLFFRFLIALFFYMPFLNLKKLKNILKKEFILIGFFSAGGYVFQFIGQKYTLAGRSSLFINMYILWIPFLLFILRKEKLKGKRIIALILSLSGLFFLFHKNIYKFEINYFKGDILTLISSFFWAFYIILAKKLLEEMNPLEFSAIVILLTAFFLLPFSFINFKMPYKFQGYYAIFHLSFFCTFLAYFLYHTGLSKTEEFTSSLFLLLEVIFALILSSIFLGERFSPIQIIGSILILSGTFLGASED